MKYKWNFRKTKSKQHLCTDDGMTFCKAENGTRGLDIVSDKVHPTKAVCSICKQLAAHRDKHGRKKEGRPSRGNKRGYQDLFLRTWEWKMVRYDVLKRSQGRCELCGRYPEDGVVLNVDHIKPRKSHPHLALSLSNLQVLCSQCNQGKANRDDTDWREPHLATLMGEAIND